ncbi:MAG TPA: DUF6036 family nucleotidyltransferase [Acidimicrobiales bacterium]
MPDRPLDRASITEAFDELSQVLAQRGIEARLFVVGGAAITLAYGQRRMTRDVDAIFEPKEAVYAAAREVAGSRGLPDDWLNDAAKGFAPGPDPNQRVVFRTQNLEVAVASPEYLLAMKLLASRADQDVDDIRLLYSLLGYTTAEEGMDLIERYYPRGQLQPRIQFLLEEMFGPSHQ